MRTKENRVHSLLNEQGIMQIFAVDHRDVFDAALSDCLQHKADLREIRREKERLLKLAAPYVSGCLLDPVCAIEDRTMVMNLQNLNVMMGIENSNYDIAGIDDTYLYPYVSLKTMKELGCSMVKLFVYYHPYMEFHKKIKKIITDVADECRKEDMPFLLEPILYSERELSQQERFQLMKETLKQLQDIPVTIYKLEFPGDLQACDDEANIICCQTITELLSCPWIVLSFGVSSEVFEKQIALAGQGGACGYAAGRSIWKGRLHGTKEDDRVMQQRMKRYQEISNRYCVPCMVNKSKGAEE